MEEYEVKCEECGNESFVHSYDYPEFCPHCGRRTEVYKVESDEDMILYVDKEAEE
jgi:uncharacterized OB-fold protein